MIDIQLDIKSCMNISGNKECEVLNEIYTIWLEYKYSKRICTTSTPICKCNFVLGDYNMKQKIQFQQFWLAGKGNYNWN